MSWNSKIENAAEPVGVVFRLRSSSVARAIAVDDSDRPSAAISATFQSTPASMRGAGQRGGDAGHLRAAPAEDRPAQRPQALRFEFEADHEQQQHHAEFGEVQDVLDLADQAQAPRADGDAGQQVAEHGAEAEALGDRHRDHRGGQVDQRVEQQAMFHGRRLSCRGRGAPASRCRPAAKASTWRSTVPASTSWAPCSTCGAIQACRTRAAICSNGARKSANGRPWRAPAANSVGRAAGAGHQPVALCPWRRCVRRRAPRRRAAPRRPIPSSAPACRTTGSGCRKTTASACASRHAFARDVDVEVGIGLVQVVHEHAVDHAGGVGQAAVHARQVRRGVRVQHENAIRIHRRRSGEVAGDTDYAVLPNWQRVASVRRLLKQILVCSTR